MTKTRGTVAACGALLIAILSAGTSAGAVTTPRVPSPSQADGRAVGDDPGTIYGGSCNLVVPRAARVVAPSGSVGIGLNGDCARDSPELTVAGWYVGNPTAPTDRAEVFRSAQATGVWKIYDNTPLGVHYWKGDGAVAATASTLMRDTTYDQNAPLTVVRVGSWAGLTVSRSGPNVVLSGRAVRYSTAYNTPIAWTGARGNVQYRNGSIGWSTVKMVTTDKSGAWSVPTPRVAGTEYKVSFADETYIWGADSPVRPG